jgi:hypothetical protein
LHDKFTASLHNKFAASLRQVYCNLHDKFAASWTYGDFDVCVDLLQSCFKLADLS